MKKQKTIRIEAQPAKPVRFKTKEITVCDFCQTDLPSHGSYGWYPKCSLCGRDCCRKHNRPDPHEYGDYPDWFCDICYKLRYDTYQDEYLEMVDRHEKEEESFMKKLKEISLNEHNIS